MAEVTSAGAADEELSAPRATPSVEAATASLVAWSADLAAKLDIPAVAVQAYAHAELRLAESHPGCHVAWTTLAGLGAIESDHGRHGGAALGADGVTSRPIRGLPLDGRDGTKVIRDTDQGALDDDDQFDRAVGPMQFIPSTWRQSGVDGNGDGVRDPNNIFDAALAAGGYLCADDRDLSRADDWQDAVLSYNAVRIYLRDVFARADEYGKLSRAR